MFGDRNYSAELGRADVVAMCRAHPQLTAGDGTSVDVRAACDTLARWDARDDADSRGAVLWSAFYQQLNDSDSHTWWRVPYDPAQPLTTPRGINGDDANVQRSLADAVQSLESGGLPVDTSLGTVQRWAGIPLPGCGGGEGCFNVVHAGPDSGSSGAVYPTSLDHYAGGSSFVMAVELTSHGPRARTILTYGESANPTSPHFADQTALFSHKRWVTERFTDIEINADPSLRITTLRRSG
jgi:acyl-homoserine-lactone acylase